MSNQTIPRIGLGTFRLSPEDAYSSTKVALEEGYTHIDTAQIYENEEAVGKAIKESGLNRESLFLTTKVWLEHLSKDKFLKSVTESLKKLQTDYVNLLLIHWPDSTGKVELEEYITELMESLNQQYTQHIGVSNFTIDQLKKTQAIMGDIKIFTNQIEVHPYLSNHKVVRYAQKESILISAYKPLASGQVIFDPIIQEIAAKHQNSTANVVLAWLLAKGMVVFPSSRSREHLKANLESLNITLDKEDIDILNTLNKDLRLVNPEFAPDWD